MEIKIISLSLIFFSIIITVWGIYMIHMYPGKVAKQRKHPQLRAIEVTAVMGLIIFPLWILALIWAHSNAIVGKLYNKGDFSSDEQEADTPEPPVVSSEKKAKKEKTNNTE
ncbi:MAG: hypothetical protein C0591_11600 [Marinilabiliales bacterium]|nr:MAG: hypothetical protein C0591_11600 [Marinilabiliales bacterium]